MRGPVPVTLQVVLSLSLALLGSRAEAAAQRGRMPTYLLPMTCQELLPDQSPYIGFLEAVAMGSVTADRNFSKRLLRILALRSKLAETSDRARDSNPVDLLIRKTLCFYREQKEPLKPVPYDDPGLVKFMHDSLKELELKVEDAIYQVEFERAQRKSYELQLQKNKEIVERIRDEAEDSADRSFERIATSAKQKVKTQ